MVRWEKMYRKQNNFMNVMSERDVIIDGNYVEYWHTRGEKTEKICQSYLYILKTT